ncbi:MAG TPA: hypothetical protein VGM21_07215 [Actinomycetota bacterium]
MAAPPPGSPRRGGRSPGEVPEELLRRWRAAEERLYPVVMVRPDLYERSIELVRSIADELRAVTTTADLVAAFGDAAEIAARVVRRESLAVDDIDLALATSAAFGLRHRELVGELGRGRAMERIGAARERGEAWVVLHEAGTPGQAPAVPYRRLEMHLGDGAALHVYVEQDVATARPLYGVEAVQLDPHTGDWLNEATAWAEPRTYAEPGPWQARIEELRGRLGDA